MESAFLVECYYSLYLVLMEVQKEKRMHPMICQPLCGKEATHRFLHHLPLGELPNISGLGFLTCKTRPLEILCGQYFFKLMLIQDMTL